MGSEKEESVKAEAREKEDVSKTDDKVDASDPPMAAKQLQVELKEKSGRIEALEAEKRDLEASLEQLDEENSVVRKTLIDQRDQLKGQLTMALKEKEEMEEEE